MDEVENRGGGGPSEPNKDGPRDGAINFTRYTDAQLDELRCTIDCDRFPINFGNLLAEIELRTDAKIDATLQTDLFAGRFTRHDGIRGWIEAKTDRSPIYGGGSIEITQNELVLSGWQRTWLGAPLQAQVAFTKDRVQNVTRESSTTRFELKNAYWPVGQVVFSTESPSIAEGFVEKLPAATSPDFERRWEAIQDFNARLRAVTQRLVVTPAIVAANVLMFVAMCILTKRLGGFTQPELIVWGANIGPLTVNGQWWRLLSATFVHFSVLHLLLNMWALWNVGRLCEYIFGRLTLAFLYFASGLLASLSSIAWNPDLGSVGASGAIFGIFGAFLAFFLNPQNRVPATIARRHWISTGAFAVFNLASGALQPGIDNAAHVGGLLAGFALGWILTRPLEVGARRPPGIKRGGLAVSVLVLLIGASIWQVKGSGSELTIPERYYRSHAAFVRGEVDDLRLWNDLAVKATAGAISDQELGERFERDIVPFWRDAHAQLDKENQTLKGALRPYSLLVADFVRLRDAWAQTLVKAAKDQDSASVADAKDLMLKANLAQARIERIEIRARMDHRPRALVNSPVVAGVRRLFIGYRWTCVGAPAFYGAILTAADNHEDGPSVRQALGCRAQQLFMSGDYVKLDALLNDTAHPLADLPDGSSRYEGVIGGLSDLFYYGGQDLLQLLDRTADWRRSLKKSARPDVLEAMIFSASAWSVRGAGYAKSVSAQQWAVFAYRTEMAAASLADTAASAHSDPVWYQLSLNIGLDQGLGADRLRAVFDEGNARFPLYRPLERRMMRILMPRWGGSYGQEEQLINALYEKTAHERGFERYAELYSEYSDLEGDEVDVFSDSEVDWNHMKSGYLGLLKRYPTSDFVLNQFANMSCRAADADQYRALSGPVVRRYSSAAWSAKYSREACDKKFADSAFSANMVAARNGEPGLARLHSLGGLQLGVTAKQLIGAKGAPIFQRERTWTYNSIDSSHNGVLTAVFSARLEESDDKVVAIEYVGDESSAPPDIPYLNGLTEVELKNRFGYLVGMGSPTEDITTLRFRNGVYADTRDGKVFRYGIYDR